MNSQPSSTMLRAQAHETDELIEHAVNNACVSRDVRSIAALRQVLANQSHIMMALANIQDNQSTSAFGQLGY
jgi:hypothetical protein